MIPATANAAAVRGSHTTAATPAPAMTSATSIIGAKPGRHGAPNQSSWPNSSSHRKSVPMSSSGGTVAGCPSVPRSCATARRTGPPPSDPGRASRHTPATRQAIACTSTQSFRPPSATYQLASTLTGLQEACTNP